MLNIKRLSIVASLLLLVGIVGSLVTYQLIEKPKSVTQEIDIEDNDFTGIDIIMNDGHVELIPTDASGAFIEISGYDITGDVSATVEESTLTIVHKEKKQKLVSVNLGAKPTIVKVHVPQKNYDTLRIQSDNGIIDVSDINADLMTLESDNGKINADHLEGTTVKAKAHNGRIHFKQITADSVSIDSDNGRIELEDIKGQLSAKANNGRIELLAESLDYPVDMTTDNGRIDLQTVNAPTNATIIAQATNGSSTIFDEKKSHTVFGSGELPITLSSKNGKITVGQH
ncbi:DUF4097 family beta strand repeat-containing protein [Sporosarcina sp. FSL K6-1522]|uniref:DUF4097 family beta strand repeat-containing protein n=1 Tax=Sporosarcina sp. FSL K6-1522 TaxID=2921554 RepID=UPI003159E2B5